jgi:hypothetical protein
MSSITQLSVSQLRKAATLKEKIQLLENELGRILGSPAKIAIALATKKKGTMSAAARAKISAAAKARWAKVKKVAVKPAPKVKGGMSAAGRAKISAAAKARWAKAKAAGRKSL